MRDKKFFTAYESSIYLRVSISTLKRWEATGKIISVRDPNKKCQVYPKEQLEKARWRLDNLDFYYFKR